MKRMLLSVKELAQELGISTDSVYRAYRKGEIPAEQINRMIRFNLEKVHRAMEQKAEAMPNKSVVKAARDRLRQGLGDREMVILDDRLLPDDAATPQLTGPPFGTARRAVA